MDPMDPFGSIWTRLGPYGPAPIYMGPWAHMRPYGPMGPGPDKKKTYGNGLVFLPMDPDPWTHIGP